MGIKSLSKKIKLGKIRKIKTAPRWADIKKFGLKRARTRRIEVDKIKKWRRTRLRV
ncbi:MAG: hypothetical protein NZ942_00925 [Candidatus Aenigmarchaeota archaeon]|nr:hypothetical protein [Candidatus Aenigmarchaeota archaeon]